jgi:GTPase SAR1 family protein
LREVEDNKEEGCQIMLLGNKSDLEASVKRPTVENINELKTKLGTTLYFETSAKTADAVENAFNQLTMALITKRSKSRKVVEKGTTLKSSYI